MPLLSRFHRAIFYGLSLRHLSPKKEEEPQTKQEVFPLFRQRKKLLASQIIHIIRHGHTLFQQGDQKMIDVRLSAQGIQQASCIGQQLLSLKPDVILVSPLTRALDTLRWALHPFKDERSSLRLEVSSLHTEHVAGAGDIGRDPQSSLCLQRTSANGSLLFVAIFFPGQNKCLPVRRSECVTDVMMPKLFPKVIPEFML
ncbi:hypothetical protein SELMODRAFT_415701 [Selaginella moellendorffii]|uniref:Serine/threonine-protein phosphatase PGAM5, mitochondrial n=1 Tax=Selaginella moellendorffii TaxID=88036 RepID=D8RWY9_SELML|nr:hypothetical protein SELMODRAFT_415701 [Selaginella moellendorffii]